VCRLQGTDPTAVPSGILVSVAEFLQKSILLSRNRFLVRSYTRTSDSGDPCARQTQHGVGEPHGDPVLGFGACRRLRPVNIVPCYTESSSKRFHDNDSARIINRRNNISVCCQIYFAHANVKFDGLRKVVIDDLETAFPESPVIFRDHF